MAENQKEEKYAKILDKLIDKIGGKEWCLKQLIPEFEYRDFSSKYRDTHKKNIFEKIQKNFYDAHQFDESNIIDIEMSNSTWSNHIMKLYFYDKSTHRFFEFSIKNQIVEEISLFTTYDDDDDDEPNTKTYPKSFFSKIKNGNSLWDKYRKVLDSTQLDARLNRKQKENDYFNEKIKQLKLIDSDEFEKFEKIKTPEQYNDGKIRFIYNNVYYYEILGTEAYITFEESKDILLEEPAFSKLFNEKIISQLKD
jgi:hypothetical protein